MGNETGMVKSVLEYNVFSDPNVNIFAYDEVVYVDGEWVLLREKRYIQEHQIPFCIAQTVGGEE